MDTTSLAPLPRGEDTAAGGELDFAAVYVAHRAAIYNYVRRMLANETDAEDCTVTVFEKALRAWDRHPPPAELRPWLFRIATNACLDELRRRQRIRWQPWNAFISLFHPSQIASDDPEAEVIRDESAVLIRTALTKLSDRDRAALVLREYHGLAVEEIAQALGVSRNAAKMTLFRARERLRAAYLQMGGELPESLVAEQGAADDQSRAAEPELLRYRVKPVR